VYAKKSGKFSFFGQEKWAVLSIFIYLNLVTERDSFVNLSLLFLPICSVEHFNERTTKFLRGNISAEGAL